MAKKEKKVKELEIRATEALAVRYRPGKIEDLLGQKHVVTQVKGMRKLLQFPSTILVEGLHGAGKTTTARIIASMMNCATLSNCGECDSCSMGKHPDIHQLNMGADGKVENIRKMITASKSAPMFRKRVYILDEAHNLTGAAAQALLVPLEEPSENTVWILCTTNPDKMNPTILSRCTRLTMKAIAPEVIIKRLSQISKLEGVDIKKQEGGKDALQLIADMTNGHMRDSIALLESVIYAVASGEKFDTENVLSSYIESFQANLDEIAVKLLIAIIRHDLPAAIKFSREVSGNARGLLHKMRWLLDFLIANAVGSAKFTPYAGSMFLTYARRKKLAYGLPMLIEVQQMLVELEIKYNSTSIDESILMQTALGTALIAEYNKNNPEGITEDSSDGSDRPSKKKKSKKESSDDSDTSSKKKKKKSKKD
jgi:DNA polymerase III subunit gamma/tau